MDSMPHNRWIICPTTQGLYAPSMPDIYVRHKITEERHREQNYKRIRITVCYQFIFIFEENNF